MPVADAEDRHAEVEDRAVRMRRLLRVHALRPAREDHADHAIGLQLRGGCGIVVDFREDLALADAAGDDLRKLGAKIKDSDGLRHGKGRKTADTPLPQDWIRAAGSHA
jgi:hypothetical protein